VFGRSVLSLFVLFFGIQAFANQEGIIVSDEAYIFVEASFEAKVLAVRPKGEKLQMSTRKKNGFYRVKMFNGQLGWASEADVQPTQKISSQDMKSLEEANRNPFPKKGEIIEEPSAHSMKSFATSRYWGLFLQNQGYREKTLGKTRKADLSYLGFNLTGFDTLMDGPFYLDTRIMMAFSAPEYYKKLTGESVSGFSLKAQTAFVSASPYGDSVLFHYGFGISTTLSQFRASLPEGAGRKSYTLEDLTVGLVIPVGFSFKLGPTNTQILYQYYHEKVTSSGISLGLSLFY
jgi:hypothetical protein